MALGFLVGFSLLGVGCGQPAAEGAAAEADPLDRLGVRATEGAAAGYLPDLTCRTCHQQKYDSYQDVGMAISFARAGQERPIEDFSQTYYHEPSQRYYRVLPTGDGEAEARGLLFQRWQLDSSGARINEFEIPIDWVLGSGNRTRSYLYQTEWGELYQLPIGWYSEDGTWGMSPGFERADHQGVRRIVPKQCMACHNALPEVAEGSDEFWQPHRFPDDLPSGTGCQRCHGPGAQHVRSALGGYDLEATRAAITNPARLASERRDSVCFQCHMLPAVSVVGARRFERTAYSFRPGQLLSDYQVHVDIDEDGLEREDRFEINHHGYRFWQSPCYQESAGELACFSCHDPHEKPESRAFRQKVDTVCLGCHTEIEAVHAGVDPPKGAACADCHMPTRRTQDVIHVTMTDHRISTGPFDGAALVAPLARREPQIIEIEALPFGDPPGGAQASLYRTVTALRAYPSAPAVASLTHQLATVEVDSIVPWLDLAEGQLKTHQFAAAEQTARKVLARRPDIVRAHTDLGVALMGLGRTTEAIAALETSIEREPTPAGHYNLGLALARARDFEPALEQLEIALRLRPNMHLAQYYRGRVLEALERPEAAIEAWKRALAIEPTHASSYRSLVSKLRELGEEPLAEAYLEVGRTANRAAAQLRDL